MADGRKNNGGHSTKGFAGRKPKADEIKIIEQMDAIAAPQQAWEALWIKCAEGDTQAIKTWLAYRYGQPKQSVDMTTQGDKINTVPEKLTIEILK
jgi:hypothetical protein